MRFQSRTLAHQLLAAVALLMASAAHAASPLAPFKTVSRVFIVSAPAANDPAFVQERDWLHGQDAGLKERDLDIIYVVGDKLYGRLKAGGANAIRNAAGLPDRQFGVALIGKDGSVALRQLQPLTTTSLFRTIDAMPMRRAEMAKRAR